MVYLEGKCRCCVDQSQTENREDPPKVQRYVCYMLCSDDGKLYKIRKFKRKLIKPIRMNERYDAEAYVNCYGTGCSFYDRKL